MAFDDGRSRDTPLVEAGEGEEIVLARLDLDSLREWRSTEVWGVGHRRPETYRRLVEPEDAKRVWPGLGPGNDCGRPTGGGE